jgi:hypothetical protein
MSRVLRIDTGFLAILSSSFSVKGGQYACRIQRRLILFRELLTARFGPTQKVVNNFRNHRSFSPEITGQ